MDEQKVKATYREARERYRAEFGVDTEAALAALAKVPLSLNCWQGDDVRGFEAAGTGLDGGLAVTGNHPGRARTPDELRADLARAMSLIPGPHKVNLHAIYGEFGGKRVDRDEIGPEHFRRWMDWAKGLDAGLDFNATCFSHPKAAAGWTLSSPDRAIRDFWVGHVKRARAIGEAMGRGTGKPCVHNLWITDGAKDTTVTRWEYRSRLNESLNAIYAAGHDRKCLLDSIEGKLFGIGSESFVAGSHEFYLAYAVRNGLMPCLDMGHYHPTESVADKVSAILQFCPSILIHVSRGVRWDSDHVATTGDELLALMAEIVRIPALDRVHLALDYFDASLNRVGAWVVGARATLKAILIALLEPRERLRGFEEAGDNFGRLALLEEAKAMPWGAVWDKFCAQSGVPAGADWIKLVQEYERDVLSKRR